MRNISPELSEHLKSGATTVCSCWIIRRKDGAVFGFTDHDNELQIEGVSCLATSGLQPTEAVSQLGLSADAQEIEGAVSAVSISQEDLMAGRFDDARVEVWLVNWNAPDERLHMRTGLFGEVSQEDNHFRAELRGLTALLDQRRSRSYARRCDAILGDQRCRVNLADPALKTSGRVVEVNDRLNLAVTGLTGFEIDWFALGQLTWTSGSNVGLRVEVSASGTGEPGSLVLWNAMPFAPLVDDTFDLTAGCNKSFAACKAKFANHLNFRGFPHLPGSDFALGYAGNATVHDGGPLIS